MRVIMYFEFFLQFQYASCIVKVVKLDLVHFNVHVFNM